MSDGLKFILREIEEDYERQGVEARQELLTVLTCLHKYVSKRPGKKKLETITRFITKKINVKGSGKLTENMDFHEAIGLLRNRIIHKQRISDMEFLKFAETFWVEIPRIYQNTPQELLNVLSYAMRLDRFTYTAILSVDEITSQFKDAYDKKNAMEKVRIIKIIIPLVAVKLGRESILHRETDIDGNSL